MLPETETIVAVATPPGTGPIGIVRWSGPAALQILRAICAKMGKDVDIFSSGRIYYGKIVDISTANHDLLVDEAMFAYFKGPRSYTGEDVVEVYSHGSPYILQRILSLCVHAGARLASPGEFTQRAFLNGRIDLVQAEAVADVIAASSEEAHRCAVEQLDGRLSRTVRELLSQLTELRCFVEATIDFPEEDIEMIGHARVAERLEIIEKHLHDLSSTFQAGRVYREGARVVLVGRPNAGKSSLLNALLGQERAIVHEVPGTTRDVIEEPVCINGVMLRLMDTAGLHTETSEEVERIGMERTRQQLRVADVLLLVIDGSLPMQEEDRHILHSLPIERTVIAMNKNDLPIRFTSVELDPAYRAIPSISVSAKSGDGLVSLQQTILACATGGTKRDVEGLLVTNARHKEALDAAVEVMSRARTAITQKQAIECVAELLRQASESLGHIVGTVTTDDLLHQIFSRFCIGK